MPVLLTTAISRFEHLPRYRFYGFGIAAILGGAESLRRLLDLGVELGFAVEGGYDDIPAFVTAGVITEMPNDPTADAVVVRVDRCHSRSI